MQQNMQNGKAKVTTFPSKPVPAPLYQQAFYDDGGIANYTAYRQLVWISKKRAYTQNSRAAGKGKVTGEELARLQNRQGGKCGICGKPFNEFHIDHIIPLSRGGSNTIGNLQLTHSTCNLKKGSKSPEDLVEIEVRKHQPIHQKNPIPVEERDYFNLI